MTRFRRVPRGRRARRTRLLPICCLAISDTPTWRRTRGVPLLAVSVASDHLSGQIRTRAHEALCLLFRRGNGVENSAGKERFTHSLGTCVRSVAWSGAGGGGGGGAGGGAGAR